MCSNEAYTTARIVYTDYTDTFRDETAVLCKEHMDSKDILTQYEVLEGTKPIVEKL
jgi:hypothetical protein